MLIKDILEGVQLIGGSIIEGLEIQSITDDSRKVKAGGLFIAIKGFESDGHDYIEAAVEKGALAIVCERDIECSIPVFVVKEGRKARAEIACNFYGHPSKAFKVIGVTGTNGKTSVSTMLGDLLGSFGKNIATLGTNGNFINGVKLEAARTTPDSIELQELFLKMKESDVDYCLMEVSSHALSLDRVHGTHFELGIFTNLTEDHLDFHPTMEDYFEAKASLFNLCEKGLVNTDDLYGRRLLDQFDNIRGFGLESNDIRLEIVEKKARETSLLIKDRKVLVNRPGLIQVYNMSTVLLSAELLGFKWHEIVTAMDFIKPVEGRMEIFGESVQVIVDYAHTPDALSKIISDVRFFTEGQIITVFGCGGDRDPYKRKIMGRVGTGLSDYCFITNDNPRTEDPEKILKDILEGVCGEAYTVQLNREIAIMEAVRMANEGDSVIVAGKGHETYQVIGTEKIHFDDREVVKKALEEKV